MQHIILGVAINESGWGNSSIAQSKNNIFGLNAVDSNPALKLMHIYEYLIVLKNLRSIGYLKDIRIPRIIDIMVDSGNKELGANVKYASDPYWGEKNAAHAFNVDKGLIQIILTYSF